EGHKHKFLKNYSRNKFGGFFSRINPGLISQLLSARYDVILIVGYTVFSVWLAFVVAKLRGMKVIWRGEVVNRPPRPQTLSHTWLKRTRAGLLVRRCDAVLYSCSGNREFLEAIQIDRDKLFPFLCAVDNEFMQESRRKLMPL